jgi:oligoendopeptidase F
MDPLTTPSNAQLQPTWHELEPQYAELEETSLRSSTIDDFLHRWGALADCVGEGATRLHLATLRDTSDEEARRQYTEFFAGVYPHAGEADQRLIRKLLASGIEPQGFDEPLRRLRVEAGLFRPENLTLMARERELVGQYNQIVGAQLIEWDGAEVPPSEVLAHTRAAERTVRERAWRAIATRQLADRPAIDELWPHLVALRTQMAANVGFDSYLDFRWQQLNRNDYMPEDARRFHRSIEEAVVPVLQRVAERRRRALGIRTIRPWDVEADPFSRPALHPFRTAAELAQGCSAIFHRLDPHLGAYFDAMRADGLLDLEARPNKVDMAFSAALPATGRQFIFMNVAGVHQDVQVLFHECGHAYHSYVTRHLHRLQRDAPIEMKELASTTLEFLASRYLEAEDAGFYSPAEAAQARAEHLERSMNMWPLVGAVDCFQHWIYQHPDESMDPAVLDGVWADLQARFFPWIDWSGLQAEQTMEWRMLEHIHLLPLYSLEYGLALLGAVQIWQSSRQDLPSAFRRYREALALGGTVPLPALYEAAGAGLAFEAAVLQAAVLALERGLGECVEST